MLIELLIDPSCKRIVFNRFGDNRNGCLTNIPQDICGGPLSQDIN